MRTNYRINSGVRFQMLSDDQLQELFDGVLHVLEHTGLDVYHEEAVIWSCETRQVLVNPHTVRRSMQIQGCREDRTRRIRDVNDVHPGGIRCQEDEFVAHVDAHVAADDSDER